MNICKGLKEEFNELENAELDFCYFLSVFRYFFEILLNYRSPFFPHQNLRAYAYGVFYTQTNSGTRFYGVVVGEAQKKLLQN